MQASKERNLCTTQSVAVARRRSFGIQGFPPRVLRLYLEPSIISCACVCAQWLDMDLIEQFFRLNSDSKLTAEGLAATLSVGARVRRLHG